MKTILYMATSVNGLIAGPQDETDFVSHESWKSFEKMSKKAGNIIIGYNTYRVSCDDGTFPYPEVYNVVVTDKHSNENWEGNIAFVSSPKEALKMLEVNGFTTAFLAGGGILNNAFLQEGLVDEIILDIEPVAFGEGKPVFGGKGFACDLELIKMKKLSSQEVQLHYKVKK